MQSFPSFWVLCALACLLPAGLRADALADDASGAERVLSEALAAVRDGDLTTAGARCGRLHVEAMGAYCRGAVALGRRDYPHAITLLRRALADVAPPLPDAHRLDAEGRLARAERAQLEVVRSEPLVAAAGATREGIPQDAPARAPLYKNAWMWSGIGVFVAAAALGLGLGMRREAVSELPIAAAPFATAKGP